MASLADIPDAFLDKAFLLPFIEWLKLLPTTPAIKRDLLHKWAAQTGGTPSEADFRSVSLDGLIHHGS